MLRLILIVVAITFTHSILFQRIALCMSLGDINTSHFNASEDFKQKIYRPGYDFQIHPFAPFRYPEKSIHIQFKPKIIKNAFYISQIDSSFLVYETTNEEQGLGFFNGWDGNEEVDSVIKAVEKRNAVALVPEGYEELGRAHVEDLLNCHGGLSEFLGIPFPKMKMKLKIFISLDGTNKGFELHGVVFYKKSQENIDFALQDVLEDSPEGFLYNSSEAYCANTHELTHAFVEGSGIPGWANEGLAEYSQKINQPGSKEHIECVEDGFYRRDVWGDVEYKFFPFSDLSEWWGDEEGASSKWYTTAMCLMEEMTNNYGRESFLEIMQEVHRYQLDFSLQQNSGGDANYTFIVRILAEVLGDSIYDMLNKYGFEPVDYQPYN